MDYGDSDRLSVALRRMDSDATDALLAFVDGVERFAVRGEPPLSGDELRVLAWLELRDELRRAKGL